MHYTDRHLALVDNALDTIILTRRVPVQRADLCIRNSTRNTGTIFADCPAMTLAVLTPPCSFPWLAGAASWRFH